MISQKNLLFYEKLDSLGESFKLEGTSRLAALQCYPPSGPSGIRTLMSATLQLSLKHLICWERQGLELLVVASCNLY